MDFKEAQLVTRAHLKVGINNAEELVRRCALDYGRRALQPTVKLGMLDSLPVEVLQIALLYLDVESLLIFRRANRRAIEVMDAIPEVRKVMAVAPNVIRMAVGIRTHRYLTIPALLEKLAQKHCDDCHDKLRPYLDLFYLRRRCFGVDGDCRSGPQPTLAISPKNHVFGTNFVIYNPSSFLDSRGVRYFTPIQGFYSTSRFDMAVDKLIFASREMKTGSIWIDNADSHIVKKDRRPFRDSGDYVFNTGAMIYMPWVTSNLSSNDTEEAAFCSECRGSRDPNPQARGRHKTMHSKLYSEEEWEEHSRATHPHQDTSG